MNSYLEGLFSLKGQAGVVTGGGGVLCGAISRGLANAGAKVAVLDLAEAAARRVADAIVAEGGEAIAVQANVLDKASLERARDVVLARFGKIDFLINGAGGNSPKASTGTGLTFFDVAEKDFQFTLDLNLMGTVLTSQIFAKAIADRGEGAIINISSMNALRPLTRVPAYAAGKAAVKNFTEWLAVDIAQNVSTKIRVNALAPGFFLTEQNRYILNETNPRGKAVLAHTPAARFGQPEDLVGAVIWLLSPAAAFVTGATIVIDGGFSAWWGV